MIDVQLAKAHLAVDHNKDDYLIREYISAAISQAEKFTCTIIKKRSIVAEFESFGEMMSLISPVKSVDWVTYLNTDGERVELAQAVYKLKVGYECFVYCPYGEIFPQTLPDPGAVQITYTAGYTDADLPSDIRSAILILVSNLYDNREAVAGVQLYEAPMSFRFLLSPYRKVNI